MYLNDRSATSSRFISILQVTGESQEIVTKVGDFEDQGAEICYEWLVNLTQPVNYLRYLCRNQALGDQGLLTIGFHLLRPRPASTPLFSNGGYVGGWG